MVTSPYKVKNSRVGRKTPNKQTNNLAKKHCPPTAYTWIPLILGCFMLKFGSNCPSGSSMWKVYDEGIKQQCKGTELHKPVRNMGIKKKNRKTFRSLKFDDSCFLLFVLLIYTTRSLEQTRKRYSCLNPWNELNPERTSCSVYNLRERIVKFEETNHSCYFLKILLCLHGFFCANGWYRNLMEETVLM